MPTAPTTIDLTLPRPLPWQREVRRDARRFNAVAVGRRAGKSTMGYELIVTPALRGYPVAWFAPTYKLLGEAWRSIRKTVQPITRNANGSDHRIELVTNGVIEMWTLEDENAGRSRKYRRVVIDEAGLVADLGARWNDAIRPTLADYAGDAWALGTPKGRNFFWQMHQWGNDATMTDWATWQKPTMVNPYIAASEIEDMRRTMPERVYAQEILAQFLEDGGGVFRGVAAAATLTPQGPIDGHEYAVGIDWGKQNDYTVLAVIDATLGTLAYMDRFNQIDYTVQIGRLQALNQRYRPYTMLAERNSMGEPLIERCIQLNLPVTPFLTSNTSKAEIIDGLSLAFERRELTILDDPTLIAELQAYEAVRLPSGLLRYSAPEGMHDDCVMALALAWHAASTQGVTVRWLD